MKRQYWIFTFGCGQQHAGFYVKIWGTFGEARQKMFDKYGSEWSFQYSEEKWKEIENDPRAWYKQKEPKKEPDLNQVTLIEWLEEVKNEA